jgi:hypothetical protein
MVREMREGPRPLFILLYLLLLATVTAALGEILLRAFFQRELGRPSPGAQRTPERAFLQPSPSLGWSHIPGASGYFTNGSFRGEVHIDGSGNRMNSRLGTYIAGYRDILFLGDSTTASLEVNDDATVPALLERALREQGRRFNVINLGVRGYGTDQSVRKALEFSRSRSPFALIYMYVENDPFENNTLREGGRQFGKGVYLRPEGNPDFIPYDYPVPASADDFAGLVVLDGRCLPQVRLGVFKKPGPRSFDAPRRFLENHFYLARGLGLIRLSFGKSDPAGVDPEAMTRGEHWSWSGSFYAAYSDVGDTRTRCREYFDSQMRFLLGTLRGIPGLQALHVVHFPDSFRKRALAARGKAASSEAFRRLVAEKVVDSYLDLTDLMEKEGRSRGDFQCPYDEHFCEKGTDWIASEIAAHVVFP